MILALLGDASDDDADGDRKVRKRLARSPSRALHRMKIAKIARITKIAWR
jgi:hypothetical protein